MIRKPNNEPIHVKTKSINSSWPCPLLSHHSFKAPPTQPAKNPEKGLITPTNREMISPTTKCFRLSACLKPCTTLLVALTILGIRFDNELRKRSLIDGLLNISSPETNIGGCVLPDITPIQTFPVNNIFNRSMNVGFQHDTHCVPSLHTCSVPHSSSVIFDGRCNTFVDCGKSIGFIFNQNFAFHAKIKGVSL